MTAYAAAAYSKVSSVLLMVPGLTSSRTRHELNSFNCPNRNLDTPTDFQRATILFYERQYTTTIVSCQDISAYFPILSRRNVLMRLSPRDIYPSNLDVILPPSKTRRVGYSLIPQSSCIDWILGLLLSILICPI